MIGPANVAEVTLDTLPAGYGDTNIHLDYGLRGSVGYKPSGAGQDTARRVFDAWKASSGHNAAMLGASYVSIGIARAYDANSTYRWYWTLDLGSA